MARDTKAAPAAEIPGSEEDGAGSLIPLPPIAAVPVVTPAVSTPIAPAPSADFVTAPRRQSSEGLELDEWGLPRAGPIRVARLADLARTDPNIDPTGWARIDAPTAPQE